MERILLLIPSLSYRADDFLKAAERLGVEVVVGSDQRQTLEHLNPGTTLTLDFQTPEKSVDKILRLARERPFKAVVSTDEDAIELAAMSAEILSLPHNPVSATRASKNKDQLREILRSASVPSPSFRVVSTGGDAEEISRQTSYPCVLKPTFLSASRGVIRANNPNEFALAFERIKKLLRDPEVRRKGGPAARRMLVEEYIPGGEVALEGLLQNGSLSLLALFDKPDPLEGPFFEETLYITPSRLIPALQTEILHTASRATRALGLREGPVHAEMRYNQEGVFVLEVAARSIGGLCSRILRFGTGLTLEEIILRQAMGVPIQSLDRSKEAAGVMMIPIPSAGILAEVEGIAQAKGVPGIDEVTMMIRRKQKVVPLPEGRRYLGFIFAHGEDPERVETSLRKAHAKLKFTLIPSLREMAPLQKRRTWPGTPT